MIYLDTSCLLKLLIEAPDSGFVRAAVDQEEIVVVSVLTELETETQIKAAELGGNLTISQWRRFQARLVALRNLDPFHFRALAGTVFQTALRQHRHPQAGYSRPLDRLHLAAMEELSLTRLMTHDEGQAKVARALGYTVARPGRK